MKGLLSVWLFFFGSRNRNDSYFCTKTWQHRCADLWPRYETSCCCQSESRQSFFRCWVLWKRCFCPFWIHLQAVFCLKLWFGLESFCARVLNWALESEDCVSVGSRGHLAASAGSSRGSVPVETMRARAAAACVTDESCVSFFYPQHDCNMSPKDRWRRVL